MEWLDTYRDALSSYIFAEWADGILLCGDCAEVMESMLEGSIDLTVTSPPYDNLRDYKGYTFDFESIANRLYQVTKKGGVVVWVVADATINGSETGTSFKQALYFKEIGFNLHDTMIYEHGAIRYPETTRYYPIFEYMFIFSNGKPKAINLLCDRRNQYAGTRVARKRSIRTEKGTIIENSAYRNEPSRRYGLYGIRHNIWRYASGYNHSADDAGAFQHPAIFPEQLAIDHTISWSNPDDIVLDPMLGSGTTAIAALRTNRRFIGIEISEEYCRIAKQRINDEYEKIVEEARQLEMFKEAAGN